MRVDAAIIGGTGVGSRLAEFGGVPFHVPTELGMMRGNLTELHGKSVLLLKRHSAGHKVPPHHVNYASMAKGLQSLGVGVCLSSAAVGSLREDWPAGTLALCSDFLDLTYRNPTLYHRTVVHTDFTEPFGTRGRGLLQQAALQVGETVRDGAVYICGNGPRYETPYEIETYRKLGGDVVGMTAATEAILMREAGIDYACLAVVTNLAAGLSPHPLTHQEVEDEMKRSGQRAVDLFLKAIEHL